METILYIYENKGTSAWKFYINILMTHICQITQNILHFIMLTLKTNGLIIMHQTVLLYLQAMLKLQINRHIDDKIWAVLYRYVHDISTILSDSSQKSKPLIWLA